MTLKSTQSWYNLNFLTCVLQNWRSIIISNFSSCLSKNIYTNIT